MLFGTFSSSFVLLTGLRNRTDEVKYRSSRLGSCHHLQHSKRLIQVKSPSDSRSAPAGLSGGRSNQ